MPTTALLSVLKDISPTIVFLLGASEITPPTNKKDTNIKPLIIAIPNLDFVMLISPFYKFLLELIS
jgi:hypothetical protein